MVLAGPEQQPLDQSDPRRASTASARSQWSLPDPNSNPRIRVVPAGPQLQALDRSGPRRTSTTKNLRNYTMIECQKECQNICQKVCQNRCQIECQKEWQNICQKECQAECQNKYAIYTSKWHVRNYVRIVFQGGCHSKKVICNPSPLLLTTKKIKKN